MTTEKRQSENHRIVRMMAASILGIIAGAFALYAFAAWSGAAINCAADAETAELCSGSRLRMWVFVGLTIAALLGALTAWRRLDA